MGSYLERRIRQLRKKEFGPTDPRTPSLASRPGTPLSLENERHIAEHQLRTLQHIQSEAQRARESREAFWSDPEHLKEKLDGTIRCVSAYVHLDPKAIADAFSIEVKTGSVVVGPEHHYIEIQVGDQPVYIFEHATLPEDKIPMLQTVASLGITY